VLDQNFPLAVRRQGAMEPAVSAVGLEWPFDITLVPLAEIDRGLVEQVEDWQILEALHRRGGIDGFISNDERILSQTRELVVLSRTLLVLVVTHGVAHNPLRATGLLMVHLSEIAKKLADAPRTYRLKAMNLESGSPINLVRALAAARKLDSVALVHREVAAVERQLGRELPALPPAIGRD
jgi:hypothetical protein